MLFPIAPIIPSLELDLALETRLWPLMHARRRRPRAWHLPFVAGGATRRRLVALLLAVLATVAPASGLGAYGTAEITARFGADVTFYSRGAEEGGGDGDGTRVLSPHRLWTGEDEACALTL